jgi:hypothetical protein
MPSTQTQSSSVAASMLPLGIFAPAMDYLIDAAQRSVLFWDVMRQRGNQYRQHLVVRRTSSTTRWSCSSTAGRSSDR